MKFTRPKKKLKELIKNIAGLKRINKLVLKISRLQKDKQKYSQNFGKERKK